MKTSIINGSEVSKLSVAIQFTITSVAHRLRASQGVSDGKPVKQATNHPKTRQKRAGSVFTACMSMRASA
jgi:hypothetical protein